MERNEELINETLKDVALNESLEETESKDLSSKAVKKSGKKFVNTPWCTIIYAVCLLSIAIGIQLVVTVVGMIPTAVKIMTEVGGDMEAYTVKIQEAMQSGNLVVILEIITVLVSLIFSATAYYLGFVRRDIKKKTFESVLPKLFNLNSIFFLICGSVAVMSVASALSIVSRFIFPGANAFLNQALDLSLGDNMAVALFIVGILAPVSEELIVRGLLVRHSRNSFGLVGCMIMSMLFFSVYHMNIIQAIYVIPMGLFWGFIAYKFKSVIPSIICHMINNFCSGFLSIAVGDEIGRVWIYVIIFLVFTAVTVFLGLNNKVLNGGSKIEK